MTTTLTDVWWTEQFGPLVINRYESAGRKLKGTVSPPVRVEGGKYKFKVAGGLVAKKYSGGKTVPGNAYRGNIDLVPEPYYARDDVNMVDANRMNANEKDNVVLKIGNALGRQSDQLVIDAMNAEGGLTTVGAYANAWTLSAAAQAVQLLRKQIKGAEGDIFCPMPTNAWSQMLTYDAFSNSLWVGSENLPLATGLKGKMWNGVFWFEYGDDDIFPLASDDDRDFFLYHRNAVGFGDNIAETQFIPPTRIPETFDWEITGIFDAGSKTLLPPGIIRCQCDDDAPIAFS